MHPRLGHVARDMTMVPVAGGLYLSSLSIYHMLSIDHTCTWEWVRSGYIPSIQYKKTRRPAQEERVERADVSFPFRFRAMLATTRLQRVSDVGQ